MDAHPGVEPFWQLEPTLEHVGLYERMVRSYASMQQGLLADSALLDRMGVPDRRPAALPGLLEELLADTASLHYDGAGALTRGEHERITAFVPRFTNLCARLDALALPAVLVNVDFWRDNIAVTDSGFTFFDWAESVMSSPVQSMTMVLRDLVVHDVADRKELHDRLLGAYLDEWTGYASPDELRQAYRIAQPAAVLCRALSWRDSVASLGEPRRHQYLRPAVAGNTRRLLEFADLA
ncbi:hypothetical protein ACIPYS_39510 [Kitasatospora sp. NPDC089913]|uniref:hypothetical protein n=1 Tax=Kitasatospora sp. NPDC089913 TaxID=3364080 RepID=UPI003821421F